ncbi:MAG: nitroreductase family protein [Candidatus Nanoarchaeia archaeon]
MDTLECIRTRRSIRKFKRIPVEWAKIGRVIEAGTFAPSAGNLQDFRFMVVNDDEKKKQLAHFSMDQMWMADAPVYIVVSSVFEKCRRFYGVRGERLYSIQAAAAAIQNILLAAHTQGLGACWVGGFDEDHVSELLQIPDYVRVQAIIPVGYADEKPPAPPKYHLEDMCHINFYGDNSAKVWNARTEVLKEWSPHVEKAVDKVTSTAGKGSKKLGERLGEGLNSLRNKFSGK